jgi:hypothetical protein
VLRRLSQHGGNLDSDGSCGYIAMHIPDDPLYYEKFYYAGDLGFRALIRVQDGWAPWFVGISGIPRAHG